MRLQYISREFAVQYNACLTPTNNFQSDGYLGVASLDADNTLDGFPVSVNGRVALAGDAVR